MKCKICNLIVWESKVFSPFCSHDCKIAYQALKDEFKRIRVEKKPFKKDKVNVSRNLHRRKT